MMNRKTSCTFSNIWLTAVQEALLVSTYQTCVVYSLYVYHCCERAIVSTESPKLAALPWIIHRDKRVIMIS